MRVGLFLDDERKPSDVKWIRLPTDVSWDIVRSYDEFVRHITKRGLPEVITFDHDLAWNHYTDFDKPVDYEAKEKTGYHCAKWFTNYCKEQGIEELPEFYCHSMNPVGKNNILRELILWQDSQY